MRTVLFIFLSLFLFSKWKTEEILQEDTIATMTYEPYYNGLNFSLTYHQGKSIPAKCFPCYEFTKNNLTVSQCQGRFRSSNLKPEYCKFYFYSTLTQKEYYDTMLLDPNKNLIARIVGAYVPESQMEHLNIQLTSVSYKLYTGIPYNNSLPCSAKTLNDVPLLCLADDGSKTENCNCTSGKIVGLGINTINRVSTLYQGYKLLIKDSSLQTASTGQLSLISMGVHHYEYLIKYFTNEIVPNYCITCLQVITDEKDTCEPGEIKFGRQVCRTFRFSNLKNGTTYSLKIFDGDNVLHSKHNFTLPVAPYKSDFVKQNDTIIYTLFYKEQDTITVNCKFYFKEDPSYEVECSECNCYYGKIQIPDPKIHKTLIITDPKNDILAMMEEEPVLEIKSDNFPAGGIIGIIIFLILVLVVVITFFSMGLKPKKSNTIQLTI